MAKDFARLVSVSQWSTANCAAFADADTSAIFGATSLIDVREDSQPQPNAVIVVMPVAKNGISHFATEMIL